jgi:bacillolysin
VRWLIGENIPGFGAIRHMQDPSSFGAPDRMTSSLYENADDNSRAWDQGDVHSNSGVNNKAAYLMTDGGTFNGKTVKRLGITKVAKIYYEAQTNLFASVSDYRNLYAALRWSCANLTGTSGVTSANCQEVKDAVDATETNVVPPTQSPEPRGTRLQHRPDGHQPLQRQLGEPL